MQYKKLGLNRLFKGFISHQVMFILTENRSALPNVSYHRPLAFIVKRHGENNFMTKIIITLHR